MAGNEAASHGDDSGRRLPAMSGRSIHVFASDSLPFPGCARTAGGNRSMQVISALREAGHRVTFSFDFGTHIARSWADKIDQRLTDEDRWRCLHHQMPEIVLNRVQPDIAIYCNINTFDTVRRFARDIVHIVDLNGPVHFEEIIMTDPGGGGEVGAERIEQQCWRLVERLRQVDYVLTVSDRQKYFWLAYCSLAGFRFSELNALVCPFSFETEPEPRRPAGKLTIVHAGGFYPWQNPERFLREAAASLDRIPGARLEVAGGPHPGMSNDRRTADFLKDLAKHRSVRLHGFLAIEKLNALLSTAWAALDLMEQSVERELAVNGRTLQFLGAGIPVIYNDYSTLSADIRAHRAGWTVPAKDPSALTPIFQELVRGGRPLVEELSANALRLSQTFDPVKAMRPLVELCGSVAKRRPIPSFARRQSGPSPPVGRVLAISPQTGTLSTLRMANPLGSLHRQRLIDGFSQADAPGDCLARDNALYEVIILQRAMHEHIYLALANLGLNFILDVDDNLIARAAYRHYDPELTLLAGLCHASALTVPNPRLVRLLEKQSGFELASRAFVTPNALPFGSQAAADPAPPAQILWIQSDIAALTTSREGIVRAVEDFSSKYRLPVVLIGRNVLDGQRFTHQVTMGEIDFDANLQLLASAPCSLGVAPLETSSDAETLDFIRGKSDLKILLFSGYGHAGVFSDAAPYTDSPFGGLVRLADNSYSGWMRALEYEYREGWKTAGDRARRVREERNVDRVARESWAPAIQACVLPKPVRGADLYELLVSSYRMHPGPARALGYLAANPDVGRTFVTGKHGAWEHYLEHGKQEGRSLLHDPAAHSRLLAELDRESEDLFLRARSLPVRAGRRVNPGMATMRQEVQQLQAEVNDLRASLSWRITAPIRALTKPILTRLGRPK
ncbi:MAG: glycosyltransferase family 4 protein [Bryobacteraceae bacterium]|nr:glycosyltransferase family 4 protein [Bryobacteraceae bacterium]